MAHKKKNGKRKIILQEVGRQENTDLLHPMQIELRAEDDLQECYIEEVPSNGVVLGDGVPKFHTLVVRRPFYPLIIK